jgi:hypothetical protein
MITTFDDSNQMVKYDNKGNGAGETSSVLGEVVELVSAVRNDASTTGQECLSVSSSMVTGRLMTHGAWVAW